MFSRKCLHSLNPPLNCSIKVFNSWPKAVMYPGIGGGGGEARADPGFHWGGRGGAKDYVYLLFYGAHIELHKSMGAHH